MSFIPTFEIGLWNSWILIIPLVILWIYGVKFLFSKRMPNHTPPLKRKYKILSKLEIIIMFGSFIYSIFMPIKFGTIWFNIGFIVYLFGLILIVVTMINFASTPMNMPVIKGVYRYSRNPMFIGWFLLYFGISIACISWVYLLITLAFIIITVYLSPLEEALTLNHYGIQYRDYMKTTPKWIGLSKSKKRK